MCVLCYLFFAGFLSWCRNAYLSTVVGVAMMAEGASALAQSAGLGELHTHFFSPQGLPDVQVHHRLLGIMVTASVIC